MVRLVWVAALAACVACGEVNTADDDDVTADAAVVVDGAGTPDGAPGAPDAPPPPDDAAPPADGPAVPPDDAAVGRDAPPPPDDSGPGTGLCSTDMPCADDQWCDYADNGCGAVSFTGVCRARPILCPLVVDPVCGCDFVTYGNECEANLAGVDKGKDGPCDATDA